MATVSLTATSPLTPHLDWVLERLVPGEMPNRIAVAAVPEDDSGVGRGRGERDLDPLTGVQPDTFEHDRLPDGLLAHHDLWYRHVRCHKKESFITLAKPGTCDVYWQDLSRGTSRR